MRGTIALATLAIACNKPAPLFERIYALDEIPTFSITLSTDAQAALAQRPREWVSGGFAYDDKTIDSIGVRFKGHRSLRKLGAKPSFKLDLDRFGKHELANQKAITLNNMVEDPSMMREVLAYRLYRALGVAAPRAGFAEVVVNGEAQGMYAVIESIDKKFLKSRFEDPNGPMYEGEYGCDVIPDDVFGFDADGGPAKPPKHVPKPKHKPKHGPDRPELARFAEIAAGDAKVLFGPGSPLDVPAFLRFLAVEQYVGNFDGYRHGHNYRLYFDPGRERWYFIPWGLDRTFVKNMSIFDSHGHLAKRCFADTACRLAYLQTMRDVVAEARKLTLEVGVDVIGVVTQSAVSRDATRSFAEIKKTRTSLRTFLVERPGEVDRELACLDAEGKGDCDGIPDVAPFCTPVIVGVAKFSLCEPALTYLEAQQFCAARGETLARIDDAEQAGALLAAVRPRQHKGRDKHVNNRWWIGLDDRADEGTFRWVTAGSSYTNWDRGEPDNAGCNQDCVVFDLDDGKWHDTHCLEPRPFVCRAP